MNAEHFQNQEDIILIDDICDGGRTFIEIAREIEEYFFDHEWDFWSPRKYLIVTHAVFSAGFKELGEHFDGIYCTNSYSDITPTQFDGVNMVDVSFVKQLNVF